MITETERRQKNQVWLVADERGVTPTWDAAAVAVLMDLRDELQQLNRLLGCVNFVNIPTMLMAIRKNTTRPRKRRS